MDVHIIQLMMNEKFNLAIQLAFYSYDFNQQMTTRYGDCDAVHTNEKCICSANYVTNLHA